MTEEHTNGSERLRPLSDNWLGELPLESLEGTKVLLVEDEAIIAVDLEFALEDAGAEVVGPAQSLPQALALARDTPGIDAAILDVDLAGESVLKLADLLVARSVPTIFHTGCDVIDVLEKRFPDAQFFSKPVMINDLLWCLAQRIA